MHQHSTVIDLYNPNPYLYLMWSLLTQPLILNAFTFDLANQRFHKKPLLLGITPHIMGGLQMLIIIKKHISIVIILHCIDIFTFSYITYILYKVSLKKMILYKVVQLQKTNSLSKLVPHK